MSTGQPFFRFLISKIVNFSLLLVIGLGAIYYLFGDYFKGAAKSKPANGVSTAKAGEGDDASGRDFVATLQKSVRLPPIDSLVTGFDWSGLDRKSGFVCSTVPRLARLKTTPLD